MKNFKTNFALALANLPHPSIVPCLVQTVYLSFFSPPSAPHFHLIDCSLRSDVGGKSHLWITWRIMTFFALLTSSGSLSYITNLLSPHTHTHTHTHTRAGWCASVHFVGPVTLETKLLPSQQEKKNAALMFANHLLPCHDSIGAKLQTNDEDEEEEQQKQIPPQLQV